MNKLNHIAFIMDGNGRWAKARNLERSEGHKQGLDKAEQVIFWCKQRKIPFVSFFVFSTENWKRPTAEVTCLFSLADSFFSRLNFFIENDVKILFAGERKGLPKKLLTEIDNTVASTAGAKSITIQLCLNYGGKQEIVSAVNKVLQSGKTVTEKTLGENMYQNLPAPDVIVRTGGQKRLSNFLLFQSAYSELYFSDTLWPDFSESEMDEIFNFYTQTQRNFGGLKSE